MTFTVHANAEDKRRHAQEAATRMGLDDTFIDLMVEDFYTRVRQESRLGPIFEGAIGQNWESHLPKMKAFWGAIIFSDSRFNGSPVKTHQGLSNVAPDDFEIWLKLFRETLDDIAPTEEAKAFLTTRAERIAESLKMAMFFRAPKQSAEAVQTA